VREAQLRLSLGAHETAVRLVRARPWPRAGGLTRAAAELFYAQSLVAYAEAHAWEIGEREQVAAADPGRIEDLRTWTERQIFAAAGAAYADLWRSREALGVEPVSRFAEFLRPSDYPPEVRGTLRDALSYLYVEVLARSGGWSPEQRTDKPALDLPALLEGDRARSGRLALDDAAVHPLSRIGAILDDLEAWHRGRGARDAALEARLARVRVLEHHFNTEEDRKLIAAHLRQRLGEYGDRPWWAMGQAALAELLARDDGDLPQARAVALAGATAFPASEGGRRCRAIVTRIQRPELDLASMRADGLGRRSLLVTHKNLGAVHFRAYPLDVERQIAASVESLYFLGSPRWERLLRDKPAAEWTVELPATPDFLSHQTYVTPPLTRRGLHAIVASEGKDFATTRNRMVGVSFLATDLVLVDRATGAGEIEAQVLDGASGAPVPGVDVSLYSRGPRAARPTRRTVRKTDADGRVRFAGKLGARDDHFLVAKRGQDWAFDSDGMYLGPLAEPGEQTETLVYTDRSVYRPRQRLHFKAVLFRGRGEDARYRVLAGRPLTVALRDPQGQVVQRRVVTTNAHGSAAGEFLIPAGRPLGWWSVATSPGDGVARVSVEEYKRPTFEVTLADPQRPPGPGKPARIAGEARYFFGLPVSSGRVRWHVTREPRYPKWWWDDGWDAPPGSVEIAAQGTTELDAKGAFAITFTPVANPRAGDGPGGGDRARHGDGDGGGGGGGEGEGDAGVTHEYRLVVEVTGEGGETRMADRRFRLGPVGVEARLEAERGFFRAGEPIELRALRTDLDGAPRSGTARWRLLALAQPKEPLLPADLPARAARRGSDARGFMTPGDRLRPRWHTGLPERPMRTWPAAAEKARGALAHDRDGEAAIRLPGLAPGGYRVVYETTDDLGARYETATEIVVTGAGAGAAIPVALPIVLAVESDTVTAGGTARVVAGSGFAGQTAHLEIWRRGRRISHRQLVAGRDAPIIDIPVGEKDRGGFAVSLLVVRDHQLMTATVKVQVPWDDRQLEVALASFRDKLRPGAMETWTVTVKGPPSARPEAAAAEILAYMYDRSLDAFAPHHPPSPMSLWPDGTETTDPHSSIGEAVSEEAAKDDPATAERIPPLKGEELRLEESGAGERRRRTVRVTSANIEILDNLAGDVEKGYGRKHEKNRVGLVGKTIDHDGIPDVVDEMPAPALRSDFAETAFWRPQLLTGADGSATISFTVPDSVTSWNVWIHALSKTLSSGSEERQVRSVKELMVRPDVPRFLREGDRAELKVVVNNAADRDLSGEVRLGLADPESGADLSGEFGLAPGDRVRPFAAKKGGGAEVSFALAAPAKVSLASLRVTATAGNLSDGELRPLPVLPSRVHLAQSRSVALRDRDRRVMVFEDLARPDGSRATDRMVVSVDAELVRHVLGALPYLASYPYECTEQTLNRFVSTATVAAVLRDHPALASAARALGKRRTALAPFPEAVADPDRRMALEESPWLAASAGRPAEASREDEQRALARILDPEIAAAARDAAITKLRNAQAHGGGFPWFPGGPPDPGITLYIAHGLARAAALGVPVPKEMVQRTWRYLAGELGRLRADGGLDQDCCGEWLTFLNYVAGSYPDPSWVGGALTAAERKELLARSFRTWKRQSPYLRGLVALTLRRAGRAADAKLVWDSVMDGAKTTADEGTSFAPEERSWLWYNDTIETHAFVLRTLLELEPGRTREKDGLVLWLLRNKSLNQWKSTRATAEVIDALVRYLKAEGAAGVRQSARVTVAGEISEMVFDPRAGARTSAGPGRVVVPGERVGPSSGSVEVETQGKGFALASATWHFSTAELPPAERGDSLTVSRRYFRRERGGKTVLTPLAEGASLAVGDEVEVHLAVRARHPAEYVHLRDPRGAGFEPEDALSRHRWELGIHYYEEMRDAGASLFIERLPQGEATFKYRLRARMAGTFRVGPATVESMYAPEVRGYSAGAVLKVSAAGR
jgi:uncharacterized protein YfaS (alpha-2-macroglobulin family)